MKEFIKRIPIINSIAHYGQFVFRAVWQGLFSVVFKIKMFCIQNNIFKDKTTYLRMKEFENKYYGKRCFIVCTGPSLTFSDLDKLKQHNEYTFAVNTIVNSLDKTEFRPTFYCIQDAQTYKLVEEKIYKYNIQNIFLGIANTHVKRMLIDYTQHANDERVVTYRLDAVYRWLNLNYPGLKPKYKFSMDCYQKVYDGAIVAYSVAQIAKYMGFKEIYILGADCDYTGSVNHFDGVHLADINKNSGNYHITTYENLKKLLKDTDVKIYNATRGGKLEVFERVDFDKLFE